MSIQEKTIDELVQILKNATSWEDVHEKLAKIGFKYVKKGGGASLVGYQNGNQVSIKPSDVFRYGSLKYMQDRLGKYIAPTVDIGDTKLSESRKEEQSTYEEITRIKGLIKNDRQIIIEIAKKSLTKESSEYRTLSNSVKTYTQESIDAFVEKYKEKIFLNRQIYASATTFDAWFKLYCNADHNKYILSVNDIERKITNYVELPHTNESKCALFTAYHEAVKADRYRVTARLDENRALILDRDPATQESLGFPYDKIISNIPKMSFFESQNRHIYYTPLSDKFHHILVDDISRSNLDLMLLNGLKPSCILESSTGNFQAIFTLPKIDSKFDKMISNDIASGLNILYGDVNLSGAIHAHRAPGFFNTKKKHLVNGVYPIVKLIDNSGEECDLLHSYMVFIDGYYKYMEQNRNNIVPSETRYIPRNSSSLYDIHKNDCLRVGKLVGFDLDQSRLDFMIGVRLRGTGHCRDEVAEIIAANTPPRKRKDIAAYSLRTADAVFSLTGDMQLRRYEKYIPQWKRLEE